jgi:hypothetical protein
LDQCYENQGGANQADWFHGAPVATPNILMVIALGGRSKEAVMRP